MGEGKSLSRVRVIKLTHGRWAIVDADDYDVFSGFKWRAVNVGDDLWYAETYYKGAREYLHRFVMGADKQQQVDHRNGNGLDCRKSNLRFTTQSLNQANVRRVRSKSGYKGVQFWVSRGDLTRPWRAHIQVNGRQFHLGRFATPEEAARAYDRAALEHFGEHAVTNASLGLFLNSDCCPK